MDLFCHYIQNESFSIELILGIVTVIVSIVIYVRTNRTNRRLETLKYMSQVRREIWETLENEESKYIFELKNPHEIRQKLEYISTAINNKTIECKVIKRLSGNWLCSAIKHSGILDTQDSEYIESKRVYCRMKGFYKNSK